MIHYLLALGFLFSPSEELQSSAESCFSAKDFSAAKEHYEKLIKQLPSHLGNDLLESRAIVDHYLRLGALYLQLQEYAEGEKLLVGLLGKKPHPELLPSITVLLAKFYSYQKKTGEGYLAMLEALQGVAISQWRPEERSFFHAVEYSLNEFYDSLFQKAKRLSVAGSYKLAITEYEALLLSLEKGYFPKAREDSLLKKKVTFRLAEAYFHEANFDKTLSLSLNYPPPPLPDEVDREMLYLAATVYREKREYEKALACFENYLASPTSSSSAHYENALFEIGHFYFRQDNLAKAQECFEKVVGKKKKKVNVLSALYLGRIYLQMGREKEAEKLFRSVLENLPPADSLYHEAVYWQGEALFQMKNYTDASRYFEKALANYYLKGDFSESILYKLALCYVQEGRQESKQEGRQTRLEKGGKILEQLLQSSFKEPIFFSLLNVYASSHETLKFENLVKEKAPLLTLNGEIELLLLTASLKTTREEKEALYEQATLPSFTSTPLYSHAWHLRALNQLERSFNLTEELQKEEALKKAIFCLEKAFAVVEKKDQKKAAQILQLEIKTYSLLNDPLHTLALLEKLQENFPLSTEEKVERLYLKGLLSSKVEGEEYLGRAEAAFQEIVDTFSESSYADDALFALGTLYYKKGEFSRAYERFTHLIHHYPQSSYLADTYFWAAESLEKNGADPEKIASLRESCFEKFPTSTRAPEAFFKFYPLNDYLQGEEKALLHITAFPNLFPSSSLNGIAYYLIGRNEKSYTQAQESLKRALLCLNAEIAKSSGLDPSFLYFRYRSHLELALLDLHFVHDLRPALEILTAIVKDFEEEGHPFTVFFKKRLFYPPLYEESEFALALVYLKMHKESLAHEALLSMLKHYHGAGVKEGYYLSRAWIEKGRLSFLKEDYKTALSCFDVAQECGKNYLNEEEKLTLAIFQSQCNRFLQRLDLALSTITKVINESVASPLRHQAMLLQAEIYELQGRRELSFKQLETVAKKEGEWGQLAREKLRQNYRVR